MPTVGPDVLNGKWSFRLRSSRTPLPSASGIHSGHSRYSDTLLVGVETNAQATMDFFATTKRHYFYC